VTKAVADALAKSSERWQNAEGDQREKEATAWQGLLWAAGTAKADGVELVAQNVLTRPEQPESVRQEAARTLLKLGTQASAATLTMALVDQSLEVRRIAAAALARLMKGDASAKALAVRPFDPVAFGITTSGAVTTSLVSSDEGRRLVLPSALARKDVAALVELARTTTDETTKFDAFAALGLAGAPDAQAYLKSVSTDTKSGSVNVRKAAYRAYRRGQRVMARTQKEAR
jgi:ParB family chromosome partitioning protein